MKNLFRGDAADKTRLQVQNYVLSERYLAIKAKFDSAQITDQNRRHWANADSLSARAANDLDTRKRLRDFSRYEVANNCHARGITLTVANDIIGTGARLQCLYENERICDAIETSWNEWAEAVFLAEKLHTFVLATVVDGEAFFLLTNNTSLVSSVQLDIQPVDCDQITTPSGIAPMKNWVDGIEFDANNNPSVYHVLRTHPGDMMSFDAAYLTPDRVPARSVIHWFRADRPLQARGIPEITPALPIFSQLRRYTLAVLMSAEIAADFAVFIQTEDSPIEGDESVVPFESTNIDKGMMTPLPAGYKAYQLKPEQPTSTHDQFTKTLLREAAHCLNVPYNIATSDFSEDSYSSGRLAQNVYRRYVEVRRKHLVSRVMDRIFAAWLAEATLTDDRLPSNLPSYVGSVPHMWFFDEWTSIDPLKDANATQIELLTGVTNLSIELSKKGLDWRKTMDQQAREFEIKRENNMLVLPPGTPALDGTGYAKTADATPAGSSKAGVKASEGDAAIDTVLEDGGGT